MSIQPISPQTKANLRMEKYSSVYEPEFRKPFSANPLIMRDDSLGDRIEFLSKKNKELELEKQFNLALSEAKYDEISRLSDEAVEELKAAEREAQAYFDMQKQKVRAVTQEIIGQYHLNTKKMDPLAAKHVLQASLASLSAGLPSGILSKMDAATSKLNLLNSKSAEISSLMLSDESIAMQMNNNAMSMAKFQAMSGRPITAPAYTPISSIARIFSNAANSITNSVRGIFTGVRSGTDFSEKSVEKLKGDVHSQIKPREGIDT